MQKHDNVVELLDNRVEEGEINGIGTPGYAGVQGIPQPPVENQRRSR